MPQYDVLLVEDNQATGEVLCDLLRRSKVSVLWVHDAESAIGALYNMPAMVLVDLHQPLQNGLNILDEIRRVGLQVKFGIVLDQPDPHIFKRLSDLQPDGIFGRPLNLSTFADWLCKTFPDTPAGN